jgi:hypothetical protein
MIGRDPVPTRGSEEVRVKRLEYSPLRRLSAVELVRVAQRLEAVAHDASRPAWLRQLAARKRTEARAFARIGFLQENPQFDPHGSWQR